jgi:hypothetical protein
VYSDADDQRILSKSADTQIKATERGVLERLDSLIPVAGQTLTADEEMEIQQRRAALLSQLNQFRRGTPWMDGLRTFDPITLSPVPAANRPGDASRQSCESDGA